MTVSDRPKAVFVRAFGDPDSFRLEEHDTSAPGSGEVRVELNSCGVSYTDVLVASGGYQLKPPLPFVPGSESAGIIVSVGEALRFQQWQQRCHIDPGLKHAARLRGDRQLAFVVEKRHP